MVAQINVTYVPEDWGEDRDRATAELHGDDIVWGPVWIADDGTAQVRLDDPSGEEFTVALDAVIASLNAARDSVASEALTLGARVFAHAATVDTSRQIRSVGPYRGHLAFELVGLLAQLGAVQSELSQRQHNINERAAID